MIPVHQAFTIGYFPQLIGSFFHERELSQHVLLQTSPSIASRSKSLQNRLDGRPIEISSQLQRVDMALHNIHIRPPLQPKNAHEYRIWSESIFAFMDGMFRGLQGRSQTIKRGSDPCFAISKSEWTYQFACTFGDLIHTMSIGALANFLLGAEPMHPFLQAQCSWLQSMQDSACRQLLEIEQRTLMLGTFPPGQKDLISKISGWTKELPNMVAEGDPTSVAATLGEWTEKLKSSDLSPFLLATNDGSE